MTLKDDRSSNVDLSRGQRVSRQVAALGSVNELASHERERSGWLTVNAKRRERVAP